MRGVRLFVAFVFVALAALFPGDAGDRQLRTGTDVPCLQHAPLPAAPSDAAFRAGTANAPTSQLRWTALAAFCETPSRDLAASLGQRQRTLTASSAPQFRRFPLLI